MILRMDGQGEGSPGGSFAYHSCGQASEPTANVGFPKPASPATWLRISRRCPTLARILIRATLGTGSPPSSELFTWPRRFLHRPHWDRILELLSSETNTIPALDSGPSSLDHEGNTCPRAALARSLAYYTGWCSVELAYWYSLCSSELDPRTHWSVGLGSPQALSLLDGPERCRRAADWLLRIVSIPGDFLADTSSQSSLSETESLVLLEDEYPQVSWVQLLFEASRAISLKATPLSGSLYQSLLGAAELEGLREEKKLGKMALAMVHCASPSELLRTALALLGRLGDGPIGLWITTAEEGSGVGLVGEDGDWYSAAISKNPQPVFESKNLPPSLRSSSDLRTSAGDVIGRFYHDGKSRTRPQELERWLDHLRVAAENLLSRSQLQDALDRQHRSYVSSQEKGIVDLRDRFRESIVEFAAGAGHQINNPLATIAAQTEKLLADEVEPDRRGALRKIADQVYRIHQMIRDLHTLGSQVSISKKSVPLASILEQAVSLAGKRRSVRQLTLCCPTSQEQVLGNEIDLVRMTEELIVNASEAAGPEGRVEVRVESRAQGRMAAIEVIDTGPGFSAADRKHAFDPFYSGRSAGRGMGMGLPVAARIATEQGGQILLSWKRPTTVTIVLPLWIAECGLRNAG